MFPASRQIQQGINLVNKEIIVFTNGSCNNNGKRNAQCGSGIWIKANHPKDCAIKVPGKNHSNQIGELAAIITAANSLPNFCKLKIVMASRYVIDGLTEHLAKWEDRVDRNKEHQHVQKGSLPPEKMNSPNNLQVGQRTPRYTRKRREQ